MKKSTFNLPNLAERFLAGSGINWTLGQYKDAGLPNITGQFAIRKIDSDGKDIIVYRYGALSATVTTTANLAPISHSGSDILAQAIGFDASISNSIYGNSSTVRLSMLAVHMAIKY